MTDSQGRHTLPFPFSESRILKKTYPDCCTFVCGNFVWGNVFDIPVNLKYSIGLGSMLGIYVAAGPDFFFNFKGDKNFEDGRKLESKKAQVGINVGAGVKLVRHLQIGFNYTIPCGDSFTWKSASEAIGTKNKTWQISAAYLF